MDVAVSHGLRPRHSMEVPSVREPGPGVHGEHTNEPQVGGAAGGCSGRCVGSGILEHRGGSFPEH